MIGAKRGNGGIEQKRSWSDQILTLLHSFSPLRLQQPSSSQLERLLSHLSNLIHFLFLLLFKKVLFTFRETRREGEKEKEGEKD